MDKWRIQSLRSNLHILKGGQILFPHIRGLRLNPQDRVTMIKYAIQFHLRSQNFPSPIRNFEVPPKNCNEDMLGIPIWFLVIHLVRFILDL